MNDELQGYSVEVPEIFMGEVAGKLNTIGSWVDDMENNEGIIKIAARIPIENIQSFKEWLNQLTNSNGTIEEKT